MTGRWGGRRLRVDEPALMSDADVQALRELLPRLPGEDPVTWAVRAYRAGLVDDQEEAWLERYLMQVAWSSVRRRPRRGQVAILAALLGLPGIED